MVQPVSAQMEHDDRRGWQAQTNRLTIGVESHQTWPVYGTAQFFKTEHLKVLHATKA